MTSLLTMNARELAASVRREEYHRLLQVPRNVDLEGLMLERANQAKAWYQDQGNPFVAWCEIEIMNIESPFIHLAGGIQFHSAALAQRLSAAESQSMILLAASAGIEVSDEVSKCWSDGRPDEAFFLDRFAVAITELLIQCSAIELCRNSEKQHTTLLPHLSPGCGNWDIQDQHKLMDFLAPGQKQIGPIQMMDTGALHPQYSVMAALGVTQRKFAASPRDICRSCDLNPCAYRRVPFAM